MGGGVSIGTVKVPLLVANLDETDETMEATSHDTPAVFLVSLPKRPAELRTWLYDADATAQGGLRTMENGYEATQMLRVES
jgi:hypothetical protein